MDYFKPLIYDNLVDLAIKKLFSLIPWLGWGPVGAVVSFIIQKFATELYKLIKEWIDLEKIAFRNQELKTAYVNASFALTAVASKYSPDSKEFKNERENHKKHLAALVLWNI